tara:strand:- start:528 stop:1391 length:864 start_codon:yes stop_codon:yes gene_type:complete
MRHNVIIFFALIFSLNLVSQAVSIEDIKSYSTKLNDKFKGLTIDPATGVKGRGVISIERKLIFQYDVPEEWYPLQDIKEVVTRSLIESGSTSLYVKGKVDVGYYYFKNDRVIKMVNIDWEDLKFKLGDYIELTNHPKSNGLEFKLKVPLGWVVEEGDGPHIVKKFSNAGKVYLIYVKELGQFFSKKEVRELFSSETDVQELIQAMSDNEEFNLNDGKVVTIENHPFIYTHGTFKKERMGVEIEGKVHYWFSFIEDQYVYFMGTDFSDDDYNNEFFRITNSIKLLNQY